jgi:hypothetical protein
VDLPDHQEGRKRCFRKVLRNEADRLVARNPDYVLFKRRAQEWLRTELSKYTLREICQILHAYVDGGGNDRIDEQPENRAEYAHFRFHYDLRVPIGGRRVYFETVLEFEDAEEEDDLTIVVVNVHDV